MLINGKEFNIETFDCEEVVRIKSILRNGVEDLNLRYETTEDVEKEKKVIFGIFDEIFGEGTHEIIFNDCNLQCCFYVLKNFIEDFNTDTSSVLRTIKYFEEMKEQMNHGR